MIGDWVKEQRLMMGWTQQELANLSNIPQTTISGLETGKVKDMRVSTLIKLSRIFSVRLCEIPYNSFFNNSDFISCKIQAENDICLEEKLQVAN